MKIEEMKNAADQVADLLKAYSNPNRLMILCQLVEGEKTVGQLAELLDMRPPAMSQQLTLLRKDGLVTSRREAQMIYYALASDDTRAFLEFLYDRYCPAGPGAPNPKKENNK